MQKPEWQIRPSRPDDLEQIVQLESNNSSLPWSRISIGKDILENPTAYSLLAFAADELIGFIACWFILDETQIMTLTVDKKWRRRGIGGDLLLHLEQEAKVRNFAQVFLEVRSENKVARALYQKSGYREIAIRAGYYQDTGEDAIIMLKKISENIK